MGDLVFNSLICHMKDARLSSYTLYRSRQSLICFCDKVELRRTVYWDIFFIIIRVVIELDLHRREFPILRGLRMLHR